MTGILSRFLNKPGQGPALSLLGAHLLSAGAPTTDPAAGQRLLAEGLKAYQLALRDAALSQEMSAFRKLQRQQMKSEMESKRKQEAAEARARVGLLGLPTSAVGGPPGTSVAPPGMFRTTPGLLSRMGPSQQGLLRGLAEIDPKAAYAQAIKMAAGGPQKAAPTRERFEGDFVVQEALQPDGTWREIGRGPRWQPRKPEKPEKTLAQKVEETRALAEAQAAGAAAGKPPAPQYGGEMLFDPNLNMYYQLDPEGRRLYERPMTGLEVTTPEGTTVRTGVPTQQTQKPVTAQVEKKLISLSENLARLEGIRQKYRPEFQQIPTRLGAAWTSLKARLGFENINPGERALVTEYADYRRDAIDNINLYIKEITGAQMSANETGRLRRAVPDPGEGVFGGDDPITFESKLDSVTDALRKAAVRHDYYRKQGVEDIKTMARLAPLNDIEIAVNPSTGERIALIGGEWVPF